MADGAQQNSSRSFFWEKDKAKCAEFYNAKPLGVLHLQVLREPVEIMVSS
jgi:hypothetical protein